MNKKNQSLIKWAVIAIIIAGIIGFLIYMFSPSNVTQKTSAEFLYRMQENMKDVTDENYFKSLNLDPNSFSINVEEVVNGTTQSYNVNFIPNKFREITSVNDFLSLQAFKDVTIKGLNGKDTLVNSMTGTDAMAWGMLNSKLSSLEAAKSMIDKGIQGNSIWRSLLFSLLPTLIIIVIFVGFTLFLRRKSQNGAGGGLGGGLFGPGDKNPAKKIVSNVKFSDVAGNAEVKEEIMELVDYLKNPKKYSAAGARIPKGVLLGGPPGTGKTLLAKATAGEAKVPFYFISGSNFVEMYVGMGAKRVRDLFREARKSEKAIIFIDELDSVGRTRGSGMNGGHDEREQTLNQLLVELDGMEENSGLLVIAATNRLDVLDPALQRPGRFDRSITVNLPDIKEREEILKLHSKGKRLNPAINFANIAKRTPGYSGAELENVINEASILSVRENTKEITPAQIDEAIDRVKSGPAKKNRVITEAEKTMVAYHEAGHAVVGLKVPGSNRVQKITIIPRGYAGGYNLMLPEEEKYNATKKELKAMIAAFMGGRAAEEIIYGKDEISTGAANDIEKATKIARRMVTEFGMSSLGPVQFEDSKNPSPFGDSKSVFSQEVANNVDQEIKKLLNEALDLARKTIKENMNLLELIKDELLQKETIVYEEIEYLAKHLKPIPSNFNRESLKAKASKKYSLEELVKKVKNDESLKEEDEEAQEDNSSNSKEESKPEK
ncbi:ATP-dependent zinc metalloprotease FtsH [Candidatus Mycoplasma pogonae]